MMPSTAEMDAIARREPPEPMTRTNPLVIPPWIAADLRGNLHPSLDRAREALREGRIVEARIPEEGRWMMTPGGIVWEYRP